MERSAVRLLGYLGCVVFVGWLAFLFFQSGHPWDESEHAHAAWLLSLGRHPIDDFFQHHQPFLWSLLAFYYRVGFTGPAVLMWGRILVVLAGAAAIVSLIVLGGRARPGRSGWIGALVLGVLIIALRELFVIRPETIPRH